ncbi:DUF4249 domain-containing protein [Hymenobacter properus]|uniref:DUF4249 domain-containing protein n=1 Tax=Hymenobacter properus TaxID=2791026 RepID=A0A931BBC9_9BACT|nr:DUF4249 domain-containing protein [Hymenobacter properus]MBF9140164.1 DUF4249 domain-containing protein [Hymenobacter properus]MBR7718971.1 DUF4249 domain-containing protein [Microvirga sp. SRT04]
MAYFLKPTALLLAILALAGCGKLQNDINVPLPAYSAELVVECYLEPGKVPSLAVSTTVPYLSSVLPQIPTDVTVTLTMPDGTAVPLPFQPNYQALIDTVSGVKFHSHIGRTPLVARPGDVFKIDVVDTKGRHVTGTTTMLAPIPIDSVNYKFNDKTGSERKAYFLTNFRDPISLDDCYRLQLHKGNPAKGALLKSPEVDMSVEDRLLNGQQFVLGTSYRFNAGDTVTATLYHIDRSFYRFRQSTRDARNANGNPFAQPSAIYSNVQGGVGIFAVLSSTTATKVVR